MKIISTRVHGILDYVMGALLIVAPWLFGFAEGGAETWIPVGLGVLTIIYSLLTDYELGISHQISMKTHLGLDTASGLLLAASPWLFGFADFVFWPHLILGVLELGAVAMTETVSETEVREDAYENRETIAAERRETQRVENRDKDKNTETKVSPQQTASNNVHNQKNDEKHKSGIHNRGERAAEPSSKADDVKNNKDQTSHTNVNRVTSNDNNQGNRSSNNKNDNSHDHGNRQESYRKKRPASTVENSLNKDNGNKRRTEETNPDRTDRPNMQTPTSDGNTSYKSQDPTQGRNNTEAKKPGENQNR